MTNAPADLLDLRKLVMGKTGLTDPAAVGIVGDGAHQRTGGYHEGRDVLIMIGRYHPSAAAGSTGEDYSCRLARDRAGLTNDASGMDIGYQWPRGGNAAWVRFNRLLVVQLRAGDPALAPIRGVNYWDGSAKHRVDRQNGWAAESTTDTVDVHTHLEFYRDTAGARANCFARLGQIIDAAVLNQPLGGAMAGSGITLAWNETLDAYLHRIEQLWVPATAAATAMPATLAGIKAALDANTQTINHLADLLAQAGNPDVTPLVQQIQALTEQVRALAESEADLRQKLAAAAHAEADALDG